MVSRDKKHLAPFLVNVFDAAVEVWTQKYPDLPVPFLTCTHRSSKAQNELFAQGRTRPGPVVTNARGGESPHNFMPSRAFDIAFITAAKKLDWSPKLFKMFSDIVKGISDDVAWGGDFVGRRGGLTKDRPHFEMKGWRLID